MQRRFEKKIFTVDREKKICQVSLSLFVRESYGLFSPHLFHFCIFVNERNFNRKRTKDFQLLLKSSKKITLNAKFILKFLYVYLNKRED